MIGLSMDVQPDAPRRYAAIVNLPGSSVTSASRATCPDPVAAAFGVEFPPQVLLIGPDGRLVARDLKGPEIKEAVARVLGPPKE